MSLIFHIFSRRYTIQSISAISRAPCIRQIGAAERCRTPCNDAGQANSVSTSICLDRSPTEFNYGYMNKHTFFFYPRTSSGSRQKESNKWDCLARSRLYFYLKSIQHKYWIISIVSCFGQLLCFHNKSGKNNSNLKRNTNKHTFYDRKLKLPYQNSSGQFIFYTFQRKLWFYCTITLVHKYPFFIHPIQQILFHTIYHF